MWKTALPLGAWHAGFRACGQQLLEPTVFLLQITQPTHFALSHRLILASPDVKRRLTFIYEPIRGNAQKFLNPLVYLFRTIHRDTGASRLVAIVQFKTFPMAGDNDHFEINALARGSKVYTFGGTVQQTRLMSLICSDALDFTDANAGQVYDRAIILHIQLNPKPRHTQFRQYRGKLFRPAGDETELLCVNWAKDVSMTFKGVTKCWHNIAGTVWYLRPDGFDARDRQISISGA
jgi:hypothetical protein